MKELQKVYLSRTRSGVPGYFTNGCLALYLTEEQYAKDNAWHVKHCERFAFKFVPQSTKE